MSDVAIKYNNETIGELNESGTATLKTSQKRCVSDIEVEYTKPAGEAVGNVLNITNNSVLARHISSYNTDGAGQILTDNQIKTTVIVNSNENYSATVFSYENYDDNKYYVLLKIDSGSDNLVINVNGTNLTYTAIGRGYYEFISSASDNVIADETYNVVISDKE